MLSHRFYSTFQIAIPSCTKINCVAWNKKDGYLAVGCDGGLLKVLKLDAGNDSYRMRDCYV